MQMTTDDRRLLIDFNRNIQWLKAQSLKSQQPDAWGSYEDAAKILDRSRTWYKRKRLGEIGEHDILIPAALEKGKDWRLVGNRVEYRMESIRALKNKISAS